MIQAAQIKGDPFLEAAWLRTRKACCCRVSRGVPPPSSRGLRLRGGWHFYVVLGGGNACSPPPPLSSLPRERLAFFKGFAYVCFLRLPAVRGYLRTPIYWLFSNVCETASLSALPLPIWLSVKKYLWLLPPIAYPHWPPRPAKLIRLRTSRYRYTVTRRLLCRHSAVTLRLLYGYSTATVALPLRYGYTSLLYLYSIVTLWLLCVYSVVTLRLLCRLCYCTVILPLLYGCSTATLLLLYCDPMVTVRLLHRYSMVYSTVTLWLQVRHVYFPCLRAGLSKNVASGLCFLLSAVIHELLVSVPFHMVRRAEGGCEGRLADESGSGGGCT